MVNAQDDEPERDSSRHESDEESGRLLGEEPSGGVAGRGGTRDHREEQDPLVVDMMEKQRAAVVALLQTELAAQRFERSQAEEALEAVRARERASLGGGSRRRGGVASLDVDGVAAANAKRTASSSNSSSSLRFDSRVAALLLHISTNACCVAYRDVLCVHL